LHALVGIHKLPRELRLESATCMRNERPGNTEHARNERPPSPTLSDITWAAARFLEDLTDIVQVEEMRATQPEEITDSCFVLIPCLAGFRLGFLCGNRPSGMLRYPARFSS
jgi:hypothetical protein